MYFWFYIIALSLVSGGFGLIPRNILYIPLGSFKLLLDQFLTLYLLFIYFFRFKFTRKTKFKKDFIYFIFIALIYITIIQILRALFVQSVELHRLISNFKQIYSIFLGFSLFIFLKTSKTLRKFENALIIVGLVNSIIVIFTYFTGFHMVNSVANNIAFYRTWSPGYLTIIISFQLVFSRLLLTRQNKKILLYLIFFVIAFSITVSYARSFIIANLSGIFIILIVFFVKKKNIKAIRTILLFLLVGLVALHFAKRTGIDVSLLETRFSNSSFEFSQQTGNIGIRSQLIGYTFVKILKSNPILGKGFDYHYSNEYFSIDKLNRDTTLSNMFIMYGFLGTFLYILLFVVMIFYNLKFFYKKNVPEESKIISLALIGILVSFLFESTGSNILSAEGLAVISTFAFLTIIISPINNIIRS